MKKINTVKSARDFTRIIKQSNHMSNDSFSIYIAKNDLEIYRFGISIGKKIGNAVRRNRVKRQMRSIIDLNKNLYQKDLDYIIIIKNGFNNYEFNELNEKFIKLINKLHKGERNEK